mmetsp:Transcript_135423/g.191627  ORF Transcript_135423/g.191627 Transcript_135423/m.191627 type:complete len:254 (-) Transcript_135423:209-970(-)
MRASPTEKISSLHRATASGELSIICFFSWTSTSSSSVPSATTVFTKPILAASAELNISAVRKYRRAAVTPILAITNGAIVAGTTPSFTSVKANFAADCAKTMSHADRIPSPPPKTLPLTSATVGRGKLLIASNTAASLIASASFSSNVKSAMDLICFTSPPAQKLFPFAFKNTARRSTHCLSVSKPDTMPSITSVDSALCASGRLSVRVANFPSSTTSVRTQPPVADEQRSRTETSGNLRAAATRKRVHMLCI